MLALIWPWALIPAALALLAVPALNCTLFSSFARLRGLGFAALCVPLHAFHLGCVGLGLALGLSQHLATGRRRATA